MFGKLMKIVGILTTAFALSLVIEDLLKIKIRKKGGRKHGKRYYQISNNRRPDYINW